MSLALHMYMYIVCIGTVGTWLAPQLRQKNTGKTHINYINNLITMTFSTMMMMRRGRSRERETRGDSGDYDDDVVATVARRCYQCTFKRSSNMTNC